MLKRASNWTYDISFGRSRKLAKIEYKGHYVITFEKTSPEDSKWIKINDKNSTIEELEVLLMIGDYDTA